MHILYFTHDLSDATTKKRVRMLQAGGATVTLAGFTREEGITELEGVTTTSFGRTYAARFAQRVAMVLRTLIHARQYATSFTGADIILARNLETLAIAVRGRAISGSHAPILYEVLDIHRLLLRRDIIGRLMRTLEGWLSRHASLLLVSSPAFVREYITPLSQVRLPHRLLENKVFGTEPTSRAATPLSIPLTQPWRIGWFGIIRCRKSFDLLRALVTQYPHLLEVVIRGHVAYDQIPEFDACVASTPGITFLGPYKNPDDLSTIYRDVHFTWAIDWFEEGMNSRWLLPNRIYEGCLYGTVPLAIAGLETSHYLKELGIGQHLDEPVDVSLAHFLQSLSAEQYSAMRDSVTAIDPRQWICTEGDCKALIDEFRALITPEATATIPDTSTEDSPPLVIIPCLNEAATLEPLITYLLEEARSLPMRIVIVDGGSTDDTVAIAQRLIALHPELMLLHNPKRIQSAAINLAVATYGASHRYIIRLDAHAYYPRGYCQTLLEEARATGAASIVVSMRTLGHRGFQQAVAAAQNSLLGNGGAAHRNATTSGKYVDHGHHALMRTAVFQSIGWYDESFSHNEDAELDVRLRRAGHRIWLTARTALDYYPRASPSALWRQYRGYGRGRIRNLLRHRERPRIRQLLPVTIIPAALLALLFPFTNLALLPLALWAGLCIAYGGWLAYRSRLPVVGLSGPAAMVMHSAWSLGFWHGLIAHVIRRA